MYYELHITIKPSAGQEIPLQTFIEGRPGWHYSCIAGDPLLGRKSFSYATTHIETTVNVEDVIDHLRYMGMQLRKNNFSTVREKVELVIYDHRRKDD